MYENEVPSYARHTSTHRQVQVTCVFQRKRTMTRVFVFRNDTVMFCSLVSLGTLYSLYELSSMDAV